MSKTSVVVMMALILGGAAQAQAGKDDPIADDLERWRNLDANLGDNTSGEYLREYIDDDGKQCDAYVKKAIKKVGATSAVKFYKSYGHPKETESGGQVTIPAGELGWFCDRWRARVYVLQLSSYLGTAANAQSVVDKGYGDEDRKNMRSGGDELRRISAKCVEIARKAIDRGADPATKLKTWSLETTVGEMPARCEVIAKEAEIRDGIWKELAKEFEKPFTDAGITGDRLEALVYYGPSIDGWYLKGCKEAKSIKDVKKAKALFQWFTDSDGIITIRKWSFKGDKLASQTEKQFLTEKKAYKGCK